MSESEQGAVGCEFQWLHEFFLKVLFEGTSGIFKFCESCLASLPRVPGDRSNPVVSKRLVAANPRLIGKRALDVMEEVFKSFEAVGLHVWLDW